MELSEGIQLKIDFSDILKTYGLQYKGRDYYWQVGEITKTQGWIIHLAVNRNQLPELIHQIIPILVSWKVPFKIARDQMTVNLLSEGVLGYIHLGKLISIYPDNDLDANSMAKELIKLTDGYDGPDIPTDRHLGNIVSTRYGSFNPVLVEDFRGEPIKHIYDVTGNLIPDPYTIPFQIPKGINWPFADITSSLPPARLKLLNGVYYPIHTLKLDAKGNVIKALYFKKLWKIHSCLIKQGRRNMCIDLAGRDIQQRLKWQYDLYQVLGHEVPMPEVFDYFQENGDSYLAMAFIKGVSLRKLITAAFRGNSWVDLDKSKKQELLQRLLSIIDTIQCMHKKGYVHRDITSNNFLIDKKDKIWMIDMELAWSFTTKFPAPPFSLGTSGYMSPEQEAQRSPGTKEDIFALGALSMEFLTSLYPEKLDQSSYEALYEALLFLTGEKEISACIAACQSTDPADRPALTLLKETIVKYLENIQKENTSMILSEVLAPPRKKLTETIQSALLSLASPLLPAMNDCWLSTKQKEEGHIGNQQVELGFYEGWHTGMSGPLWLVAKAKQAGYEIDHCLDIYAHSWEYIEKKFFNSGKQAPGLYAGGAGIALALLEGINSGLLPLEEETISYLDYCFSAAPVTLDMATGLAGQGLALLHCLSQTKEKISPSPLKYCIEVILNTQQPDGSWPLSVDVSKKGNTWIGLDQGVAGIVLFLLAYIEKKTNPQVVTSAKKALTWLTGIAVKDKDTYNWPMATALKQTDKFSVSIGTPGIALTFLKAFEILKNPTYLEIAEKSLMKLPARPIYQDYGLGLGLSGLGETYLECLRLSGNSIWQDRADWIASLLLHSFKKQGGWGYWLPYTGQVTADLFTGNSGIIHFLMRYNNREVFTHPFTVSFNNNKQASISGVLA